MSHSEKVQKIPKEVPLTFGYKKILYTTDMTESGRFAFHHAASLAKQYGAELTVLHVLESGSELDRRLFGYVDEHLWEHIRTQNLREATEVLLHRRRNNAEVQSCVGKFCQDIKDDMTHHGDITYNIEVVLGEPVEEIVKIANKNAYDLIIMGAHKHSALKTWMIGSTLKGVLRRSGVPVLIVQVPHKESEAK